MTIQGVPDLGPGLRLHLNENTGGCSPKVVEAVRAFDGTHLATYPDFRAAIHETAAYLGVDPDRLVLTNGLDEGILLASIAYLTNRTPPSLIELGAPLTAPAGVSEIVVAQPAFEPYLHAAQAMGARVVSVSPTKDYTYPVDAVLRMVTPNTRIVYVNNPNNPTGQPVPQEAIRRVAREAGHAIVFVDEAYHDFLGENFLAEAPEYPNVIVGRTFSKAFGLAGMRVGVLIASPEVLQPIRRAMPLFNVNVVAIAALRAALTDADFRQLVHRSGDGVEGVGVRRVRSARPPALEERGQLRADRRRRASRRAGRRDDREGCLRSRSDEGSIVSQLLPAHHRRGRAHAQGD